MTTKQNAKRESVLLYPRHLLVHPLYEEKLSSDSPLWNELTTNLLACVKKYKYPFKALSKELFWNLCSMLDLHLSQFKALTYKHGLALSEPKMKIGLDEVDFLELHIKQGFIIPQPHIAENSKHIAPAWGWVWKLWAILPLLYVLTWPVMGQLNSSSYSSSFLRFYCGNS